MLAELMTALEDRTLDPQRMGLPLSELVGILEAPEAVAALRIVAAYTSAWQRAGALPAPVTLSPEAVKAAPTEVRGALRPLVDAGLVAPLELPGSGSVDPLPGSGWEERYCGGSAEAEAARYASIPDHVRATQCAFAAATDGRPRRAFHGKGVGVAGHLVVRAELPPELQVGFFRPGARWDAVVRLSNAANPDDREPNLHGLAVRLEDGDHRQDLLATSAPASHVADAADHAFVGEALTHGVLKAGWKMLRSRGAGFTIRVLRTLSQQTNTIDDSYAALTYYSRAAFRWGPLAVRYALRPIDPPEAPRFEGAHRLLADLTHRLAEGPVRFALLVQRFVDEARTPIEKGDVAWSPKVAPFEPVAELVLPQQDLDAAAPEALAKAVESWAFTPFHTRHHTPLGRLNRGRDVAYRVSVEGRAAR